MTMIQEIKQALKGSILRVEFKDQKEKKTEILKIIEYSFRFSIPQDWCIQDIKFTVSENFIQRLESIAERYDLTIQRNENDFIFFKIRCKDEKKR